MIRYRLNPKATPQQIKRHLQLVFAAMDGLEYENMSKAEATLVNNESVVEETISDEQGANT